MTSEKFYQRGRELQRQGLYHEAMNCYLESIALDPDSPAVQAKQLLDEVYAFYNKDMYNP